LGSNTLAIQERLSRLQNLPFFGASRLLTIGAAWRPPKIHQLYSLQATDGSEFCKDFYAAADKI